MAKRTLAILILVLACIAVPARAQDAAAPAAVDASAANTSTLDEIVVTGSRIALPNMTTGLRGSMMISSSTIFK